MIGIDTNVLVAHAIRDHPDHAKVRRSIEGFLSAGHRLALTSGIVAEFLHIATDAKRFEKPLSMNEALEWAAFWSDAEEVVLIPSEGTAHVQWLRWIEEHRLGRKRLLDTLIAAAWHTAGIDEVYTLNPRDFKIFGVFKIHRA